MRDPDVPPCFVFVFNCFLEIYGCCSESVTWGDIASYASLRKIDFSQYEINMIVRCNGWANGQIRRMRDEQHDDDVGKGDT